MREMGDLSAVGSAFSSRATGDAPLLGSSRPLPAGSSSEKNPAPKTKTAAPVGSGAEEEAASRIKEARALLAFLPERALPVAGGMGSSAPASEYDEAAVQMLAGVCGKSADASRALRLFLSDYWAWLNKNATSVPPFAASVAFPITSADALACRDWLAAAECVTAAGRVAKAMQLCLDLSLPVTFVEKTFAARPTKKVASGQAREPPLPFHVVALAAAACEPSSDTPAPLAAKHKEMYLDMLGGSRGGGFHNSRVASILDTDDPALAPARDSLVLKLVCSEDKLLRENVEQWVPAVDVRDGSPLGWARQFAEDRLALKFMIADWLPAKSSIDAATEVKLDGAGALCYASKARALKSFTDAMPSAFGQDMDTLKSQRLTGTHLYRHLAGEVSERLRWTEKQGNILGDWSTASPAQRAAGASAVAKRKRGTVRQRYYAPNATADEQVEARLRFVRALAAGFSRLGVDNVTLSTTWADVFPFPPPPELEAFYGA